MGGATFRLYHATLLKVKVVVGCFSCFSKCKKWWQIEQNFICTVLIDPNQYQIDKFAGQSVHNGTEPWIS